MKKILFIILSCTALFACTKATDETLTVTSVVMSQDKLDLQVGETATLTAKVLPESLGMGVEWSVLDDTYAEVNNGVVTAKAEGVTYVVAMSADGTQRAACLVNVNPEKFYDVYIKDSKGNILNGIYGYPGMSLDLSVETSDDKTHSFTWSLQDPSVGTIDEDGNLSLEAVESTDKNYVFDAQSSLKVVTEDGRGVKIPVRSSLLRGLKVYDDFKSADVSISLYASGSYPIAALYQGEMFSEAIPAEDVTLELSDTENFTLQQDNGSFTLVTGSKTGVETTVSLSLDGLNQKVQIAEIMIQEMCEIEATLVDKSSSTMVFTWTAGTSAIQDASKAYTLTLYRDAACTIVDQEFEIPADCGAWQAKQPKFVFGGLKPNTPYWFQAVTPQGEKSNKVKATTDAFTHVLMPSTITSTGVVLAEDFGEIRWDFDHLTGAVGFRPKDKSDFASTEVNTSENSESNKIFGGYHYSAGGEIEYKSCGDAIKNSRLNGWLTDTRVYIHPGCVKLGTASDRGWMVTPEFTVPEGKKAKVRVTVTACRLDADQTTEWALIVLAPEITGEGQEGEHTAWFTWPQAAYSKISDIDITEYYKEFVIEGTDWETKSIDGLVLRAGDRIAYGGKFQGDDTIGQGLLSDMTVEVLELVNE